ncbi:hypothetical protein AF72_11110 [Xylella taiwanensis]|uniref:Uncharacterized protein n=1 Tax=Xylella taiwanensis TaxID=1444770 RepID=Z9JG81_9GAMM|nr:hypothetical protein AF72_11110 [Xylella taiwanensis]
MTVIDQASVDWMNIITLAAYWIANGPAFWIFQKPMEYH